MNTNRAKRAQTDTTNQFTNRPKLGKKGQVPNCQICNKKFGTFVKEHQCKRCCREVCQECSKSKSKVNLQYRIEIDLNGYEVKPNVAHRTCKICKEESDFQHDIRLKSSQNIYQIIFFNIQYLIQYKKQNNLQFSTNSEIAFKWCEYLQLIKYSISQLNQSLSILQKEQNILSPLQFIQNKFKIFFSNFMKYQINFGIYQSHSTKNLDVQILTHAYESQRLSDIETNFNFNLFKNELNYSQLEFCHYIGQKEIEGKIDETINTLIQKIIFRLDLKKIPTKLDQMIFYLLAFCSEAMVFHIVVHIYENILPEYVKEFLTSTEDITVESEIWISARQLLIQSCRDTFNFNEIETKAVNAFILNEGREMLSTMMISNISFQCFYHIFDEMISIGRINQIQYD